MHLNIWSSHSYYRLHLWTDTYEALQFLLPQNIGKTKEHWLQIGILKPLITDACIKNGRFSYCQWYEPVSGFPDLSCQEDSLFPLYITRSGSSYRPGYVPSLWTECCWNLLHCIGWQLSTDRFCSQKLQVPYDIILKDTTERLGQRINSSRKQLSTSISTVVNILV